MDHTRATCSCISWHSFSLCKYIQQVWEASLPLKRLNKQLNECLFSLEQFGGNCLFSSGNPIHYIQNKVASPPFPNPFYKPFYLSTNKNTTVNPKTARKLNKIVIYIINLHGQTLTHLYTCLNL